MSWILVALLAAVGSATSDALSKRLLVHRNEYVVAWLLQVFSLPFLWMLMLLYQTPLPSKDFYLTIAAAIPLEAAAIILYIKALKSSPLSLTLPFLSLTPLFLIANSYLLLGEAISAPGTAGILLIVIGGYTLHIGDFRKGFLQPFLSIGKEKGSVYMIIVALLYSFTSTLGKKAISLSSPFFFLAIYTSIVVIILSPLALRQTARELRTLGFPDVVRFITLPGLFATVGVTATALALKLGPVAYAISIKRLSLLIGILYGHLLFREGGIRERLAGGSLMLAGFVLIVIYR